MWSDWAHDEFSRAFLGHQDRTDRLVLMAQRMGEHPAGTVPQVFRAPAERQGAYDWLENKDIDWRDVAQARHEACARRCKDLPRVIAVVDGSSYRLPDPRKQRGTGPIGARSKGARGLQTMLLAVLTPQGEVLGIGAHELWARSETPAQVPAALRPLHEKESRYWNLLRADWESTLAMARAKTLVWYQLDAGADMVDVLLQALRSPHELTVRLKTNRKVFAQSVEDPKHPFVKVRQVLDEADVVGYLTVKVARDRKTGRKARKARVEVRAASVSARLFERYTHRHAGDAELSVVRAREVGTCPEGEEPVEWELWTTHAIGTAADALEVVRVYALRWRIERLFFTTKSGACETEQTQLESFQALAKWIVLQTSVAARLLSVMYRSRQEPNVPATEEFTTEEIVATKCLYEAENPKRATSPAKKATLGEVVGWLATLGGYTGKSSGGPPGVQVLERGWERVSTAQTLLASVRRRGLPEPEAEEE